jgi:hypothetical protein
VAKKDSKLVLTKEAYRFQLPHETAEALRINLIQKYFEKK